MPISKDYAYSGTVSNGTVSAITMTGLSGGAGSSLTVRNESESDDLWYYDDGQNAYITILPKQALCEIPWKKRVKLSASAAGVPYQIFEVFGG